MKNVIPVGRERGAVSQPFLSLQREIDRLFDDFTPGFPTFSLTPTNVGKRMPVTDVTETDKEIEITVELPGLEDKDVKINLADDLLTIKGEKKAEKEQKDKDFRMAERSYGAFERTIELPEGVDPNAIEATIAKGVLTVTVPKPAPSQAKTIEVKTAT